MPCPRDARRRWWMRRSKRKTLRRVSCRAPSSFPMLPRCVTSTKILFIYFNPNQKQKLIKGGNVDAVICFGVLIKGETHHFKYISQAVSQGLMNVQLLTQVPVIYGGNPRHLRE